MPQVEERHWAIWALYAREQGERRLSWPYRQNFYVEGLSSGYRTATYRDLLGSITPRDEEIAEAIGRAVEELGRWRPKWRLVLVAWWNAVPGGKSQCHERCRQLGVSWGLVYARRDDARAWCEAYVELMHAA